MTLLVALANADAYANANAYVALFQTCISSSITKLLLLLYLTSSVKRYMLIANS